MYTHFLSSSQLLALLQVCDSMFPTGAFAHSYGLETYVQEGRVTDAAALQSLLLGQLRWGLSKVDLLICKETVLAREDADLARLRFLDSLLSAARPAAEAQSQRRSGPSSSAQWTILVGPDPMLDALHTDIQDGTIAGQHAIVFGVLGGALGLEIDDILTAYCYTFVAGQASAAVRLVPLGQTDALQTVKALWPAIEDAVHIAQNSTLADFGSFTPAQDIRAMQHAYLDGRLFMS